MFLTQNETKLLMAAAVACEVRFDGRQLADYRKALEPLLQPPYLEAVLMEIKEGWPADHRCRHYCMMSEFIKIVTKQLERQKQFEIDTMPRGADCCWGAEW